jgi:hypothetical protein
LKLLCVDPIGDVALRFMTLRALGDLRNTTGELEVRSPPAP